MRAERRAVGIADARIDLQRCGFASDGHVDGRLGLDVPRMAEVEVGNVARDHVGIGQSGARVFRREARDADSLRDRVRDALARQVAGAGRALALAAIHGHAHAPVALVLERFDIAETRGHRQSGIDGDAGLRFARAEALRLVEREPDETVEVVAVQGRG